MGMWSAGTWSAGSTTRRTEASAFDDGSRLSFDAECEHARRENRPFIRYSYRQPMGTFTGSLPGGIQLAHGLGVMEHHDAVW